MDDVNNQKVEGLLDKNSLEVSGEADKTVTVNRIHSKHDVEKMDDETEHRESKKDEETGDFGGLRAQGY